MPYKTILVHVDDSKHAATRIRIAAELARTHDAHLIGAAMTGISRFAFQGGEAMQTDPSLAMHLESLRKRAQRALELAESIARENGEISWESRLVEDDALDGVGLQARCSDLVVIGQSAPAEPMAAAMQGFPESIVFNGGRPTLIVPHAGQFAGIGKRILIAWDGSRAATRALTDAIPLLQRAALVHVAVFNQASASAAQDPTSGTHIALYLARHGIKLELLPSQRSADVGNALLSLAADLATDLIVMGGYGHSRFREIILGGVTRTILSSMTVPVLMSH